MFPWWHVRWWRTLGINLEAFHGPWSHSRGLKLNHWPQALHVFWIQSCLFKLICGNKLGINTVHEKKLIMNYKLAQSCLKRNISPLLSRQKQAWFHVKFCLLKPRKFYRTEHHNEMRKSNLDLLSIHLNIRLVICCPGPEWHIFHLLTSEDIDDIIS